MARVHPFLAVPSTVDNACSSTASCSKPYMTSKRETFTIWMKSLVMQGKGCTAYDEHGEVVYRVDNYDNKHSDEVYLMDLRGKVLFTLSEQKMCIFRLNWQAYESNYGSSRPLFRVRKKKLFGSQSCYKVIIPSDGSSYILEAGGRSAFRIVRDSNGAVLAEASRKQSSSGVEFGDDVLSLVVEPDVNHSFIMALVTVYGLIKRQI